MTLQERAAAKLASGADKKAPIVPLKERAKAAQAARDTSGSMLRSMVTKPEAAPSVLQSMATQATIQDADSMSSNIGRAVDRAQAAVGGTIEAIGQVTGSQYLQDKGDQIRTEQLAQAAEYGNPTQPRTYKDVDFSSVSDTTQWFGNLFQDSAPAMGAILTGSAAGAKAGSPFGTPGKVIGGAVGALLTSAGINIGEVQNAIHAEDPNAESPWHSIIAGTGMATLDMAGAGVLLKPLIKNMGEEVVYEGLVKQGVAKGVALDLIAGGSTEAVIGAAQGAISHVGVQGGLDRDIDLDRMSEDVINGLVGGAAMGGAIRTATGAIGRISHNNKVAGEGFDAAVREADTGPQSIMGKTWTAFGGRSTDMLKGLGNISASAKDFLTSFNPDETGKTATKKTLFEDSALLSGKWRAGIEPHLAGKSKAERKAILDDLSDPAKNQSATPFTPPPRTTPTGKVKQDKSRPQAKTEAESVPGVRKVLDDVHTEAVKRGLDIGYIPGHLPLRMDPDQINTNRSQFLHDITPYFESPEAANKAVDAYMEMIARTEDPGAAPLVNRAVNEDTTPGQLEVLMRFRKDKSNPDNMKYRFGQGAVMPEFGHLEKQRAFANVPQNILNNYVMEKTPDQKVQAIKDYIDGAAHRLAFVDEFGAQGEYANATIAKAVAEAQKAGRVVKKVEIDRMYDLIDAYNGMHKRVTDARIRGIQSGVAAGLTVKALPLVALSSMTEFITPAIRGDISSALTSVLPTFAQIAKDGARTLMKGSHRSEFSQLSAEINNTFAASTSVLAERLGQNMFNKGAATGLKWYFIGNGLSAMTHFNRVYAAKTADSIFKRNIEALARGLPVNSPKGRYYTNQLRSMGVDVNTNLDAKTLHSPMNSSQKTATREARKLAMRRFTDQSVLNPNVADTPMWMNEGRMQLFALLKRYPAAFGNTILPQLARKVSPDYSGSYTRSAGAMVGAGFTVGMMLAIGYMQDEMKQIAKSGELEYEENRTEGQRFLDVVNQTLMPLQLGIVSDFFGSSRYGSTPTEVFAGPVGGLMTDFRNAGLKTITSFENDDPTAGYIGEFLFKQSPFRPFKKAQEAIKSGLDVE